jgi:hypothetical protein
MFDFFPSKVELNIHLLVIIFVICIGSTVAYFYYRKTIPPISLTWQILLGINRGIITSLLIIVLFTPEINVLWDKSVRKKILFMIDRSASMQITEKKIARIDRANFITKDILDKIKDEMNPVIYAFDIDTMRLKLPAAKTRDLATDIEGTLKKILNREKDLSALILITDGIFTQGDNPVYSTNLLRRKIYTLGIGDTNEIPDLAINEVIINKILYQNNPATVEVEVSSRGINTSASVFLKQNEKVLDAKKVDLKDDGSLIPVSFTFKPEKLGLVEYKIEAEKLAQEEITKNNSYITSVEVLKEKVKVGIIATKPDYDIKFIRQILQAKKDINVTTSVKRTGLYTFLSDFKSTLDSADVLILYNYPDFNVAQQDLNQVTEKINRSNLPLLIIINEPLFRNQISFISTIFPILSFQSSGATISTQVQMAREMNLSSILKIYETEEDNTKFWMKCPPVEYLFSQVEFEKECKVLLETAGLSGNKPVLISYQGKGRKRLLLLGAGFWRWKFQLMEDQQFHDGWETILYNMIRWLAAGGNYENIIISSRKKIYQIGETVNLDIQVYDGSYNPVPEAQVRLKVFTQKDTFEIESEEIGKGNYRAKFVPLQRGGYKISATAWKNDINLGGGTFHMISIPVNNEFLYTKQDSQFLQKLAARTGGKYFSEKNYLEIINSLDRSAQIVRSSKTIELWNRISLVIIIILLLSLEWYIRKRKDLA